MTSETEQPDSNRGSVDPAPGGRASLRDWLFAGAAVLVLGTLVSSVFWPRAERLPDFGVIEDVEEMKRAFFAHLAPAIRAENRRVLDQRERLLAIIDDHAEHGAIRVLDDRWLKRLATEYALEWGGGESSGLLEALKRRVDIVPMPLALVQAATESGWGRSRFAVEGNNLFGQWCYRKGCGLVPDSRSPGARHEVAAFNSMRDAVASYLRNLNTHDAYRPLRRIRARLREAGEAPRAGALIDGLILYSERREEYVEEIRAVLRINRPIIEEVTESA